MKGERGLKLAANTAVMILWRLRFSCALFSWSLPGKVERTWENCSSEDEQVAHRCTRSQPSYTELA